MSGEGRLIENSPVCHQPKWSGERDLTEPLSGGRHPVEEGEKQWTTQTEDGQLAFAN